MNAPATAAAASADTTLTRAEAHGRQLLLYAAEGPLGGSFLCFRCGASALQPVLLQHGRTCPYHPGEGPVG